MSFPSPLTFVRTQGSLGSSNDSYELPTGICTDGTYLYVCDPGNSRIMKRLRSDLTYVSQIGSFGAGNDNFWYPIDSCNDGVHLYIIERFNTRLQKRLLSDLSFVAKIGTSGLGNDKFNDPHGITTDGTFLYIADTFNHRIVKRRCSDLTYVSQVGTLGSGSDQFNAPRGIAWSGGFLYVGDTQNFRIVKRVDTNLSYVSNLNTAGLFNTINSCSATTDLYPDTDYLLVADEVYEKIIVVDIPALTFDTSFYPQPGEVGFDSIRPFDPGYDSFTWSPTKAIYYSGHAYVTEGTSGNYIWEAYAAPQPALRPHVSFFFSNKFSLTNVILPPSAPPNDNFANATYISGASGNIDGTTINATFESGEPHPISSGGASVWYRWVAPSNGTLTIGTGPTGAGIALTDTTLALFTGATVSTLTLIGADDDSGPGFYSLLSSAVTSGTTYYIQVDSYGGDNTVGTFRLTWSFV